MSFQSSALIATWAALLLLALVVSGLVRQVHALSAGAARPGTRIGPPPGTQAPGLERLGLRPPAVLLFVSDECRTCAAVLAAAEGTGPGIAVHALYAGPLPPGAPNGADGPSAPFYDANGPSAENAAAAPSAENAAAAPSAGNVVRHGGQAELFERYDAIATPFAVVIDRAGRVVRSEPVGSPAALHAVLGGEP